MEKKCLRIVAFVTLCHYKWEVEYLSRQTSCTRHLQKRKTVEDVKCKNTVDTTRKCKI